MEFGFEPYAQDLYQQARLLVDQYKRQPREARPPLQVPSAYSADFFRLVDQVNLGLLEDQDNFFGYFLMQMSREIRFDMTSPTGVNFTGAKYVIHFNPLIFLKLTLRQMETTIKHEILHILSLHLIRARILKEKFSRLAINLAMNIVVNTYLDYLPPYAVTLEWVNLHYSLKLLPFQPFEYYAEAIQDALDLLETNPEAADENDEEANDRSEEDRNPDGIETDYHPEKTHDIWESSGDIDEKTLQQFTEQFVSNSRKGSLPDYLENILAALKSTTGELPWNLYLKKMMGKVESNKKKIITRRDRRQPDRMDLRGQLRAHQAKVIVALDISGSISDEAFNQALQEVLDIVKYDRHEITVVECDKEIRRVYRVKTAKDIKGRSYNRGATRFTPVFEYANRQKVDLLIYFTDGKGEKQLGTLPRGYKTLWVLSGQGDKLSLKEAYGTVKKLSQIDVKDQSVRLKEVRVDGYSMQDQERI